MKIKLDKIFSVIIIVEMLATSLGYCGHHHDHGDPGHECDVSRVVSTSHASASLLHSHSDDGSQDDHDAACHCKVHCSCLGGFLGDLPIVFEAHALSEIDRTLSVYVSSLIGFYPLLERPPQAAA